MKTRIARVIVIAALLMTPLAALAESPHYSFVQVQYGEIDEDSVEGTGFGGAVLFGGKIFQAGVSYIRTEFDVGFTEVTSDEWTVGGGVHGLLGEPADLVANVGYFSVRGDLEEEGLILEGGARWMVVPFLELNGFITHLEPNDSDSDQLFSVSAIGFFQNMGIGASYATANHADSDQWQVFLRFTFGKY
jgi:hypothetical protein